MLQNETLGAQKQEEAKERDGDQIESAGLQNDMSQNNQLVFVENKEMLNEPRERTELTWLKDPSIKLSIWAVIKDSIGKDISKLTVPVYFNDPLNLL